MNCGSTTHAWPTGVCVKSNDGTVLHQNKFCRELCGRQAGLICKSECIARFRRSGLSKTFDLGIRVFRNVAIRENSVDTVTLFDGRKITTLLCQKKILLDHQLGFLSRYKLSKTETRILKLRLQHFTNLQIANKLFISKKTVRTHLNNLYKKIPRKLRLNIWRAAP